MSAGLVLYRALATRSFTALWMLEELSLPYRSEMVGAEADRAAYLELNPTGMVPTLVDGRAVVREAPAICMYLADRYSPGDLAPRIEDPARGAYLSWLVYVDAVMDPCFVAKSQGWRYPSLGVSFGLFDDMVRHVENALTDHDYATGDQFTAADVSLASAVHWGLNIAALLPERPVFRTYLERVQARAGFQRFIAKS